MRHQGRYIRFRHLFPEVFVPGMQTRRGLLRLRWFLLQRIDFRPIWTLGAAAGLGGVLLTVSLFFLQSLPQLSAAARPPAISTPLAAISPAPTRIEPAPQPEVSSAPIAPLPPTGLAAQWSRLVMTGWWNDRRLTTVVSEPLPVESDPWAIQSTQHLWRRALPKSTLLSAAYVPYREPPGLRGWESMTRKVKPSDVVGSPGSVAPQVQPSALIEKHLPPGEVRDQPLRYQLVVTNPGQQPLLDVTVRESVDVSRVTAVEPPAEVEPTGLIWRLGGLAPGERRLLDVSVWTAGLTTVDATTEIELAERVATASRVEGEPESPFFQRTPAPTTEPPAVPRSFELPPFPNASDLPPFPKLDQLPAFPAEVAPPATPAQPPAQSLPPFPTLPATPPAAPPAVPPGRPILKLSTESPPAVAVGQNASTWYVIENVGTAPASNIELVLRLPEGLEHFDGQPTVRHSIPLLNPGQQRRAQLITRVRKHGVLEVAGELQAGELKESNLVQLIVPADSGSDDASAPSGPGETRVLPCQCRLQTAQLAHRGPVPTATVATIRKGSQ